MSAQAGQADRDAATKKVIDGLKAIYRNVILPLENMYMFADFYSPALTDSEFDSKPIVLLVGQYSTGKTSVSRFGVCGAILMLKKAHHLVAMENLYGSLSATCLAVTSLVSGLGQSLPQTGKQAPLHPPFGSNRSNDRLIELMSPQLCRGDGWP